MTAIKSSQNVIESNCRQGIKSAGLPDYCFLARQTGFHLE